MLLEIETDDRAAVLYNEISKVCDDFGAFHARRLYLWIGLPTPRRAIVERKEIMRRRHYETFRPDRKPDPVLHHRSWGLPYHGDNGQLDGFGLHRQWVHCKHVMVHHLWVRIEIMDAAFKPKPILRPDHAGGLNLEIRGDVPAQIEWMPEPTDPQWRQCVRCLCWSVARHHNGLRRKETSRLRSSPRGVSIVGFLQFIFLL